MSIPCTISTGSFLLWDFQGLCLTVNITGASPFSPITTEECSLRLPALPQQTVCSTCISSGSHMVDIVMPWSLALVDNLVGTEITLTSKQAEVQGDTAQVIFEPFTGSSEQIWTIEALD
ncbi:hypothetical protein B0H17DRAFT_1203136 [Mycena rosella]|uniref:Uncharacterized protein n=1 Tax=Mycena rosella TaxID=1033263 RepID=A0AAD7DCI9_MYCRO|nr:hypothetical protein B0H17DRAFT_1203136 [Mycena rosella]